MRILPAVALLASPLIQLWACSCLGEGSPCLAAGRSAAVFTGTVVHIADPPGPGAWQPLPSGRRSFPRPWRTVRLQVSEVLSGVPSGQKEMEIVTGQGGGDCGYPFRLGTDYVVYAHRNTEGRLEANRCSRTREVAKAAEDIQYLRERVNASAAGEIRVFTASPGKAGKPGERISAEGGGYRHITETGAGGIARFAGLLPGEYVIRAESDGDQPHDPRVHLHAKGCLDVTLLRTLRITGRVTARNGLPGTRVEVQARSIDGVSEGGVTTDSNGNYELLITRPGRYRLGINLNQSATQYVPYPRWFHPGTEDAASATVIDFSGKPESLTFDLTLPDRQPARTIKGIVVRPDGQPARVVRLVVLDAMRNVIAQETADPGGRFVLHVFTDTPYRLHAVWPGENTG